MFFAIAVVGQVPAKISEVTATSDAATGIDVDVIANKSGGTVFAAARASGDAELSKANIENGTGDAVATGSNGDIGPPDIAREIFITGLTAETEYIVDVFFRDKDGNETGVQSSAAVTTPAVVTPGTYEEYEAISGATPVLVLDFNNDVYAADTGGGLSSITTGDITDFTTRVEGADGIFRMRTVASSSDSPSIPVADFAYNSSATTVVVWATPGTIGVDFERLFSFQGNDSDRMFFYFGSSRNPRFRVDNGGVIQIGQQTDSPVPSDTAIGVACGWSTSAVKMSVNGRSTISSSGSLTAPTVTDLDLGHESGVEQLGGGIQRVLVFDSLLSDADMEGLSGVATSEGGEGDPGGGGGGGGGGSSIVPDYTISGSFGASGQDNQLNGQDYEYIDCTNASWVCFPDTTSSRFIIQNMDGPRTFLYGGTLTSTISQEASWASLYTQAPRTNQAGVHYRNTTGGTSTKFILSGFDIDGGWDSIRPKNLDFIIHQCRVSNGRDDAIEADGNNSGQIIECLLESMVALSMTDANNASDEINIVDSILCGLTYPHDNASDIRTFGPIKVNSGDARDWTAENVILAAEGVTTATSSHNRFRYMWSHLKSSTGTNYFCNLSDTTIAAAGAPTPPGSWTVLEGQEARDFYDAAKANWIATYRPYSFSDPEA